MIKTIYKLTEYDDNNLVKYTYSSKLETLEKEKKNREKYPELNLFIDTINFDTDDMKSLVNQLNNVGKSKEYKKYET